MSQPSSHLRTRAPSLSLHATFRTFTHAGRSSKVAATKILEDFLREDLPPHLSRFRTPRRLRPPDVAEFLEHLAVDFGIEPEDALSEQVARRLREPPRVGPYRFHLLRSELASVRDTPDATKELLVADISAELAMLAGVITAAEWMASAPGAAAGPQPTTVVAEDLVAAVQRRRDGVPVHRLRYESPVEIGLVIVSALTIGKVGLTTLVYMVKRVYGLDLEIRTHRAELEERHLEAVPAWLSSRMPAHLGMDESPIYR